MNASIDSRQGKRRATTDGRNQALGRQSSGMLEFQRRAEMRGSMRLRGEAQPLTSGTIGSKKNPSRESSPNKEGGARQSRFSLLAEDPSPPKAGEKTKGQDKGA